MYIAYMFDWLYQMMQIKIPFVFSDTVIFSISIYSLFIGSVFLFIAFLAIRFFLTGVISYEKASIRSKVVHKYQEAKSKVKGE